MKKTYQYLFICKCFCLIVGTTICSGDSDDKDKIYQPGEPIMQNNAQNSHDDFDTYSKDDSNKNAAQQASEAAQQVTDDGGDIYKPMGQGGIVGGAILGPGGAVAGVINGGADWAYKKFDIFMPKTNSKD